MNNLILRAFLYSTALTLAALAPHSAQAQSARDGASSLPPVRVDSPTARRSGPASSTRRANQARRAAPPPVARPPVARTAPAVAIEDPRGPVRGYVATRSSTGTKTNTAINETPQSISVIGAEQIRDQSPGGKFDEVLRYTPGVVGGYFGADTRNDWYLIRGFKADDNSTFLDGMQLFATAFATWKLQPFNLERVEVLRGPASVLYGGSSTGGIVNAVSKTPPLEPIRYLEAGVNNYGNAYLNFDFGGPVPKAAPWEGQVAYRVVGQVKGGDTQTDFVQDNNYFIAPSLTWIAPDLDTKFTVLGMASRNDTRVQQFLPYTGTVVDAPYGRIRTSFFGSEPSLDKFSRDQQMIGYLFEKNLSENWTFRQNARFGRTDVRLTTLQGLGTDALGNLSRLWFTTHGIGTQGNLDNQLEYRVNTGGIRHTVLFGVDMRYYNIDDYQASVFPATSINVLNPVYSPGVTYSGAPYRDGTLTQQQLGVYVQDQMKIGNLTVVLSGRNDFVKTQDQSRIGTGATATREDSKFTARAGIIYNFENGIAPYASYATSYNPLTGVVFSTGALRLPETGQQTEVGVKYQPLGFRGHFGIAAFDLVRQNTPSVDFTNSLLATQLGEVRSRGIELEAVLNPLPGLKMVGSHTVYNLTITKEAAAYLVGLVPVNTPRQMTSGWFDYTFQDGWLRGFGFGGGVRHIGSSFADANNLFRVPAFTLGDLAVHYEWGGNWRAAVNFQNITDKVYVASCANTTSCFYGDRRRITGSLAYRW